MFSQSLYYPCVLQVFTRLIREFWVNSFICIFNLLIVSIHFVLVHCIHGIFHFLRISPMFLPKYRLQASFILRLLLDALKSRIRLSEAPLFNLGFVSGCFSFPWPVESTSSFGLGKYFLCAFYLLITSIFIKEIICLVTCLSKLANVSPETSQNFGFSIAWWSKQMIEMWKSFCDEKMASDSTPCLFSCVS